jgi:hypothetical protein
MYDGNYNWEIVFRMKLRIVRSKYRPTNGVVVYGHRTGASWAQSISSGKLFRLSDWELHEQ